MNEPLVTRAMPGALWEHVPAPLAQTDEALRQSLAHAVDFEQSPWRQLRWLTENPHGITWVAIVTLVLALGWRIRRAHNEARVFRQPWRELLVQGIKLDIFTLALLAAFMGVADLISHGIKLGVGRLKPHVTFYNPHVTPALSLPSSHAFNLAFLTTLYFYVGARPRSPAQRGGFIFLVLLTFFVGLTRVLFDQHYPLDVVAGWVFGALIARMGAPGFTFLLCKLRAICQSRAR